jgi:hypothetical protein
MSDEVPPPPTTDEEFAALPILDLDAFADRPICNRWWSAPRHEAPRSVNVNHVCALRYGHREPCRCGCGKTDASGV